MYLIHFTALGDTRLARDSLEGKGVPVLDPGPLNRLHTNK